jgi:hypothetical protein
MLTASKRGEGDEITWLMTRVELFFQYAIPSGAAGAGGTGQTENDGPVGHAGETTGLDR